MKKLSKLEKFLLQTSDNENYVTYRCDEHGIYQIRKDVPEEDHKCVFCKNKHNKLSEEEIKKLLV
jgi:hypothetical protein